MTKEFFSSLRTRLMLIVIVAVLPASGIILYSSHREAQRESQQVRSAALRLSQETSTELARFVEGARQVLIVLARLREVRGVNPDQCNRQLAELITEFPQYLNFGVVETNGEMFASGLPLPGPVNLGDRVWFRWSLKTGGFGFGPYQMGRISGQASVNFSYPVRSGAKQVQRVVFASLDLKWFHQQIQQRELPEGAVLIVLDSEGTVLARKPGSEKWAGRKLQDEPLVRKILKEWTGTAETEGLDGVRRLYAFTPVSERGGTMYVAVGLPRTVALRQVYENRRRSLLLLGLVTASAIAAAWYVGGAFVVGPVRSLRDAARRLEAGELGARVNIRAQTGEFAELTRAFNQMARSLEERVAERVRAADAVRQSAQRLALHFNQTPLGVIEWDLEFRVTRWNPAAERIFGYTEMEAMGQHASLIIPVAARKQVDQLWQELLAQRGGQRSTNENVTKDGRTIVCEWYNTPLVDTTGQVIGVTSQTEDITDRRRAQDELFRSRQMLQLVLDNVPVRVFWKDREHRFLGCNAAVLRDGNLQSLDDVLGKTDYECPWKGTAALYWADDQMVLETGESKIAFEEPQATPEGGIRWLRTSKVPLRDATGQIIGVLGTYEDITAAKRTEEKIRTLNAELEQRVRERTAELAAANKELEAFSYSVSHDLRTPLRAIDGFSHALKEDCGAQLSEAGQVHLQRVFAATQRMAQLIDDLLKLSRVSRAEVNKEDLDLSELAQRVVAELRQVQPGRAVEVVIAPDIHGQGDVALLGAVLENLLGNAWKFTGKTAAPRIEFGQTTDADGVPVYFVRDNGAGFDMAYVGKLFGAFQRLHTLAEFPGEGIGLATVQRIIRRHGGRVWAEGAVDQGATFYFTL
jgi:PAS domain S-box-containing protein